MPLSRLSLQAAAAAAAPTTAKMQVIDPLRILVGTGRAVPLSRLSPQAAAAAPTTTHDDATELDRGWRVWRPAANVGRNGACGASLPLVAALSPAACQPAACQQGLGRLERAVHYLAVILKGRCEIASWSAKRGQLAKLLPASRDRADWNELCTSSHAQGPVKHDKERARSAAKCAKSYAAAARAGEFHGKGGLSPPSALLQRVVR